MQMSHESLSSRAVVYRRRRQPNDSKRGVNRGAHATKRVLRQARCIHYTPPISPLTRRRNVNKRDVRAESGSRGLRREKAAAESGRIGP